MRTGRYWLDRAADLFGGCVRDRDVLPAAQSIDVRFTDFMADEEGTLATVYELASQPYDDTVRRPCGGSSPITPRRHGEVSYDLADVGLDADEVARRLRPYRDRFLGESLVPDT